MFNMFARVVLVNFSKFLNPKKLVLLLITLWLYRN